MTSQTLSIIKAALNGDPTLSSAHRKTILRSCNSPRDEEAMRSAPDRLLSAKEASAILGISKRTLFRYVRRGLLHPVKLSPRTVRFTAEDIESLCTKGGGSW